MKILKCVFLVGIIVSLGQSADLQSLKAKAKEIAANSAQGTKLGKEQNVLFDEKKKIVRAYLPHLQEVQELGDRAEYNALIDERDNELAPIEHKIKETNSKIDTVYKKGQNLLKELEDIAITLGTSNDEVINSFVKLAKQKWQVDKTINHLIVQQEVRIQHKRVKTLKVNFINAQRILTRKERRYIKIISRQKIISQQSIAARYA